MLVLEAQRLQVYKEQLPLVLNEKRTRIAALDTSIRLASTDLADPAAAGTVRTFSGRYGQRGELKAFIVDELRKAAPGAVATYMIVHGAIAGFGLKFATASEEKAFR